MEHGKSWGKGVGDGMIKIQCAYIKTQRINVIIIIDNYYSLENKQNTRTLSIVVSLLCGSGIFLLSVPSLSFFSLQSE